MILRNVLKPHTNRIIRSLLKTHFVKTKHIKMRRDIDEFFVSPEHLEKSSYEVLTRHHRYIRRDLKTFQKETVEFRIKFNRNT